ncbi:MAG: glucose sorbosone dehydrogenase [Nanohaloarchaea archaeon SW_4_43_9]|nr:MAG: glucose sorbosone dehydrogenase [Nanohaloarchaea archaeon SW_4_43_9]
MKTKSLGIIAFVVLLLMSGALLFDDIKRSVFEPTPTDLEKGVSAENVSYTVEAENLSVPWDIEFLPDDDMLVTERPGYLLRIGGINDTYEVPGVEEAGEGGLLGVALHPEFQENRYIYLYQTTETEEGLTNRVVRYRFRDNEVQEPETIIEGLPGAFYHDGGRIDFGPEGFLYVTVGDATEKQKAQDTSTLHGSILRLNPNGSVPENPFDNEIYSYGHRNSQGITWDNEGRMWSTEHGSSATDEINIIEEGANYGWPKIKGNETRQGMKDPVKHSGYEETWAPGGVTYFEDSLYFTGLRGQSLYQAELDGESIVSIKAHFRNDFGRLRDVTVGPDGRMYIATSNTDGRGAPQENDDRIISFDPAELE